MNSGFDRDTYAKQKSFIESLRSMTIKNAAIRSRSRQKSKENANPNNTTMHVKSPSIDLARTRVSDVTSFLNNQTTVNTLVMSPKFGNNYRPITSFFNKVEPELSPLEEIDPDTLEAPSRLSLEGLRSKFQQIKGVKIRTKHQVSDIDA
jgi:hypothetical protein